MKSPIKWMGGKSNSVKTILPIIPEHKTYVEPFLGGGWIFFNKEKSKVEILNDINGDLVNFFEVVRNKQDELEKKFDNVLISRELFLEYRKTMSDRKLSDVERAFRFYYVNQNAFGGLIRYNKSGGCNSPFAINPKTFVQSGFWDLDKIKNAHERLKYTYIENDDYRKVINRNDTEDTLFFLDPPYDCKSGKYNGESSFDYKELLSICKGIKGKFILTLNSGFEELFKDFNIYPNDVHYSIGCTTDSSKSYKEIIVTNYTPSCLNTENGYIYE